MERTRSRSPFPRALAIFFLAPLFSKGPSAGAEAEFQVLLWIRAGDLSPAEVDPDPPATPVLHDLMLSGVTAAELRIEPLRAAGALDPGALASSLFDPPFKAWIEEKRGAKVAEAGPDVGAGSDGGPDLASRWDHPAAAILEKRFGRPPPPSGEEEEAIRRIQALFKAPEALGSGSENRKVSPSPAEPPAERAREAAPDERSIALARQATSALTGGAPLAIVREKVTASDRARERDSALGHLAMWIRGRDIVLMILSVRAEAAAGGSIPSIRASFIIAGSGVKEGRIIGGARPISAVPATVLEVLGIPQLGGREVEAIHALRR